MILKITEMEEQLMNELQGAYERVVEMYLAGAGPILDVSREKYFTQNSHNISGLNLCQSGSAFTKSHNRSNIICKDRYENELSDMMKSEDFDSENISNSSFSVINRNDPSSKKKSKRRSSEGRDNRNIILTITQGELN